VVLGLLVWSCSGDEEAPESESDGTGEMTLTESLEAAGLPLGSYRMSPSSEPVCLEVFEAMGGVRSEIPVTLSGFETTVLTVVDEVPFLSGEFDQLTGRWTDQSCVEWDSRDNDLTVLVDCEDPNDDPCTPFLSVSLCVEDGTPSFTARVEDCGQNTYTANLQ
jgi:hypothetical protein